MNISLAITPASASSASIAIAAATSANTVFHDIIAGCSAGASAMEPNAEAVFEPGNIAAGGADFPMIVPPPLGDSAPQSLPERLAQSQYFSVLGQINAVNEISALPCLPDDATEADEDKMGDLPAAAGPASSMLPATGALIVSASTPNRLSNEFKLPGASDKQDASITPSPELKTSSAPPKLAETNALSSPLPTAISQSPATILNVAAPDFVTTGHLDLARDTLWLDQLAKEIVAVASNDGKLRFSLSPQMLGELEVAISTQSDGVHIQLQTSTESAARIFAAEQPKLAEELRQSGVRLVNNDLLSGQQMGSARDQSHMQNSARHVPLAMPKPPSFNAIPHPSPAQPPCGRFA